MLAIVDFVAGERTKYLAKGMKVKIKPCSKYCRGSTELRNQLENLVLVSSFHQGTCNVKGLWAKSMSHTLWYHLCCRLLSYLLPLLLLGFPEECGKNHQFSLLVWTISPFWWYFHFRTSASLWHHKPLQLEINSHPQLQNAAPVLKLAPQWQAVLHPGDTTCTKSKLLLRKKGIETCHKLLVFPVINDGKWMSKKSLKCLQPQVLSFWGSSFHSHDTNQEPMVAQQHPASQWAQLRIHLEGWGFQLIWGSIPSKASLFEGTRCAKCEMICPHTMCCVVFNDCRAPYSFLYIWICIYIYI